MKANFKKAAVFLSLFALLMFLPAPNAALAPLVQAVPALAAESVKGNWKQRWDETVAAAKKEGALVIYTTASGAAVRKIGAAFTEKYGIKVDVLSARGPELAQKMEAQRRAGLNAVDIVVAGGTNLAMEMRPRGYLDGVDEALILPEVTDPKAWIIGRIPYVDKNRSGIGMLASFTRQVIRNTNLVTEKDISSYWDIVNPRWKGKIIIGDPTIPGAGNSFVDVLTTVWGLEKTKDFLRQLIKQDLTITRDLRQQVEWVARGKYELGVGTHGATVGEFVQLGAPVYPISASEGGMVTQMSYGLGIVNKRPNPDATALFVNWILSREGNAVLVKHAGMPGARVDSPKEGIPAIFFPRPGEKFFIATEENYKRQKELLKVAAEIFKPVLK